MYLILYDENNVVTDLYEGDQLTLSADYKNANITGDDGLTQLIGINCSMIVLDQFNDNIGDTLTADQISADIKKQYIEQDLSLIHISEPTRP